MNIYEDTATSMRAIVEGIDKTGFSRDEPWRLQGSSLPEHETFFFYLQRICNHCTYPGCLADLSKKARVVCQAGGPHQGLLLFEPLLTHRECWGDPRSS